MQPNQLNFHRQLNVHFHDEQTNMYQKCDSNAHNHIYSRDKSTCFLLNCTCFNSYICIKSRFGKTLLNVSLLFRENILLKCRKNLNNKNRKNF